MRLPVRISRIVTIKLIMCVAMIANGTHPSCS
jgi:hypothetical protein